VDIEANIKCFMGDRTSEQRYASFDYCFNYFQSFRETDSTADIAAPENVLLSCLHLGFYLASWGMFRGSSDLPSRSLKQFQPVMELIARTPDDVWTIDAHRYSDRAVRDQLISTADDIQQALRHPDGAWPTRTLATKVMLGVFGNVPAFDSRVVAGLRQTGRTGRFGIRALQAIGRFYEDHRDVIEKHRNHTLDFVSGCPTHRSYTRAKVIDEIFFIEGQGGVSAF
jgi:hypothetical protein